MYEKCLQMKLHNPIYATNIKIYLNHKMCQVRIQWSNTPRKNNTLILNPSWSWAKRDPDQWLHHRRVLPHQHVRGGAREHGCVRLKLHPACAERKATGRFFTDACLLLNHKARCLPGKYICLTPGRVFLSCSLRLCSSTSSWRYCPTTIIWTRRRREAARLWETNMIQTSRASCRHLRIQILDTHIMSQTCTLGHFTVVPMGDAHTPQHMGLFLSTHFEVQK